MNVPKKFMQGYVYCGATRIEGCNDPTILVTGRYYDDGSHIEKIKFTTNLKHRRDEMHRPIYLDYDGNEFVLAYGIMFSAKRTVERSRHETD